MRDTYSEDAPTANPATTSRGLATSYSEDTMPQDPYGAVAEEVATRVARRYELPTNRDEFELAMMHAALDAVTEALHKARGAGLLLPEGAGTRIEWGVTWHADDGDGIRLWQDGMTHRAEAEQRALSKLGEYGITRYRLQTREHRDFADGSCWSGPWSLIPPEPKEPADA